MSDIEYADVKSWLDTVDFEEGRYWLRHKPRNLMERYNKERNDKHAGVRLNHKGLAQNIVIPTPRPHKKRRSE